MLAFSPAAVTYWSSVDRDFVSDHQFILDGDKRLNLQDVIGSQAWESGQSRDLLVRSSENLWIKITPKLQEDETRIFVFDYPYVPIIFHHVRNGKAIESISRLYSWHRANKLESHFFSKSIPLQSGDEIYLLIQTEGYVSPNFFLFSKSHFKAWQVKKISSMGLFFGALGGVLIYNFIMYLITRNPVQISYVGFQLSILVFLTVFSGFSIILFPDVKVSLTQVSKASFTLFALIPLMGGFFVDNFLRLKRNAPRLHQGFKYFVRVQLVVVAVVPFIPLEVSSVLVMAAVLIFSTLAVAGLKYAERSRKMFNFYVAWLSFLACTLVAVLTFVGVIEYSPNALECIYVGVIWETLFMSLALGGRIKLLSDKHKKFKSIVSGNAPQTALVNLFEDPYKQDFKVKKQQLTIMFIDAVGFSIMSENKSPDLVFQSLKNTLEGVYKIIHKHGGSVDRTIGDGLLTSFGYDYATSLEESVHHAFAAAIEIQELATSTIISSKKGEGFPFRIGIHTAEVVIGNLGGSDRIDFTLVGEGVNFASRLEASCNPYRIVLSPRTKDLLSDASFEEEGLKEMFIHIKHHKTYFKVFEYNPFVSRSDVIEKAEKIIHSRLGRTIAASRYQNEDANLVQLKSNLGIFELVNFSMSGFAAVSDVFLGIGVTLTVRLVVADEGVSARLYQAHVREFTVEVKWSRIFGDQFRHGFEIMGLSNEQKSLLLEGLLELNKIESAV